MNLHMIRGWATIEKSSKSLLLLVVSADIEFHQHQGILIKDQESSMKKFCVGDLQFRLRQFPVISWFSYHKSTWKSEPTLGSFLDPPTFIHIFLFLDALNLEVTSLLASVSAMSVIDLGMASLIIAANDKGWLFSINFRLLEGTSPSVVHLISRSVDITGVKFLSAFFDVILLKWSAVKCMPWSCCSFWIFSIILLRNTVDDIWIRSYESDAVISCRRIRLLM